ncbi:MAG TPA: uroporphyrinogen-III synthase [Bacillales bacterium]|nr:uroporphyrinogen-III synthase [Bacillales bacterium]
MARPLEGKRILVTRAREQAAPFSREIINRGGIPVEIPVIAFRRPAHITEMKTALSHLSEFKWIIFTSANGVRFFMERLREFHLDFPKEAKIAVVGEKTNDTLKNYGLAACIVPKKFVAESLLEQLKSEVQPGDKVLMPRGNLARKVLPEELGSLGAAVTDLVVYETIQNNGSRHALAESILKHRVDAVTFTSSSTVTHFMRLLAAAGLKDRMGQVKIACIGPVTAETARESGLVPDIVAEEFSTSGLLDALEQFYGEGS